MTPKYFASSILCSTCPHMEYIKERGLPGIAMCIVLHFPGLKRMPQSLPHPSRADRSCCNARLSDWDLICLYNKQSSANSRTWDETTLGKSFICNRKSRGPSTVPCGTPDSTLLTYVHLQPLVGHGSSRRQPSTVASVLGCHRTPASLAVSHAERYQMLWKNLI